MCSEPDRQHQDGEFRSAGTTLVLAALLEWKKESGYRDSSDFLFASVRLNGQKPLSPDSILKKSIRPALVRAGIIGKQIGWHSFRHSLATNLRSMGVDLKVAQELMRHANSRTTLDIYKHTEREIAEQLNGAGILGEHGRPWTRATVHQVLTNPKYIGANIYNRRSFKLKHKRIKNPVDMWIWRQDAFLPIVDAAVFEQAGRIIESRHQHLTDQDLLERLRELLQKHGRLSGLLIDETEAMPSSSCYSSRFGSLVRAYTLIGWEPDRDFSYVEINRSIRRRHADLISTIFDELLVCCPRNA